MNSLITITNLTVSYNNKQIINNISLYFTANKITTILGKSGVGKSSLFSAILKLTPYSGTIEIDDCNKIAYMPQTLALIDNLTVYDNIIIPLKINKLKVDNSKISLLLKELKIEELIDKKITTLSGGQKSRVALARTLVSNANILLIDEALSSVDDITKYDILKLLKSLKQKYNLTIIYITHDIHEACEISDEIIILRSNDYTRLTNISTNNDFKDTIRNML